jgi:chromosome segregation ATPase
MSSTANIMRSLHQSQCNLEAYKEKNPSQAGAIAKIEDRLVATEGRLQQQIQKLSDYGALDQADSIFKSAQQQIGEMPAKAKKSLLTDDYVSKYDSTIGLLDAAEAKKKVLAGTLVELKNSKQSITKELTNALNAGSPPSNLLNDVKSACAQIKEANDKITPQRLSIESDGQAIAKTASKLAKDVDTAYKSSLTSPTTPKPKAESAGPGSGGR